MSERGVQHRHSELAQSHYKRCFLCEHRCGVDRSVGQLGPCRAGAVANVFRHRVEYGEEPSIIPSHLFYLSGCDLRCKFCIAGINAFDPSRGTPLTSGYFNAAVTWGRQHKARNVQWVGGEPTIHLPAILDVMARCPDLPPIVWKSDFHGTPESFEMLRGWVQTYIADFKFGNDACARSIAGVDRYMGIVTRNLLLAAGQSNLIVRHLLLPGHSECCYKPIVSWMREHLPDVPFSLRDSYMPSWRAKQDPVLNRPLTLREGRDARYTAGAAGLLVIQ